jgi:hypothetical protein
MKTMVRAMVALITPASQAGALHPRLIPGRMQETWLLPPGGQVGRRSPVYARLRRLRFTWRRACGLPAGLLARGRFAAAHAIQNRESMVDGPSSMAWRVTRACVREESRAPP